MRIYKIAVPLVAGLMLAVPASAQTPLRARAPEAFKYIPGKEVEVNVEMRAAYTGAWLPLVGQLTGVEFDYADGRAQREDVRYNPSTSSAMAQTVGPSCSKRSDAALSGSLFRIRLAASAVDGMPLDAAPFMTKPLIEVLHRVHIRSVEDLANAEDAALG